MSPTKQPLPGQHDAWHRAMVEPLVHCCWCLQETELRSRAEKAEARVQFLEGLLRCLDGLLRDLRNRIEGEP